MCSGFICNSIILPAVTLLLSIRSEEMKLRLSFEFQPGRSLCFWSQILTWCRTQNLLVLPVNSVFYLLRSFFPPSINRPHNDDLSAHLGRYRAKNKSNTSLHYFLLRAPWMKQLMPDLYFRPGDVRQLQFHVNILQHEQRKIQGLPVTGGLDLDGVSWRHWTSQRWN